MDEDFDALSHVWRASVSPRAERRVEALSEKVIRRARLTERVELLVCGCLTLFVVFGIWRAPTVAALGLGGTILGLLLWSTRTRYRLRRVEWNAEDRDRGNFLEGQIRRHRARVRRAWVDLTLFAPGVLFGMLYAAQEHGGGALVGLPVSWATLVKLAIVGGIVGYLLLRLRRQRAMVRWLNHLLADQRRETAIDQAMLTRL